MLRLRRGLPLARPHRLPAVGFEAEPEPAHACEEFDDPSRAPRSRAPLPCRHRTSPGEFARGGSHLCDPSPDASTRGRHGSSHCGEGTSRHERAYAATWIGGEADFSREIEDRPVPLPGCLRRGCLSPPLPRGRSPRLRAGRTAGRGTGGRRARSPRRRPAPASRKRRRGWRWLRTGRRRGEPTRASRSLGTPPRRDDLLRAIARSVPARRTKPRGRITDAIELSRALLRAAASDHRRNNSS